MKKHKLNENEGDVAMSGSAIILGILAILSVFDWSWLVPGAWAGGASPMTIVLVFAAVLVAVVDKSVTKK